MMQIYIIRMQNVVNCKIYFYKKANFNILILNL